MNIAEIRKQYPQYDDLDDMTLAQGLHKKHYSDMDFKDFSKRIGLETGPELTFGRVLNQMGRAVAQGMADIMRAQGATEEARNIPEEVDFMRQEGFSAETPMQRQERLLKRAEALKSGGDPRQADIAAMEDERFKNVSELNQMATAMPEMLPGSSGRVEDAAAGMARFAPAMATSAINPMAGSAVTFAQLMGMSYDNYKKQGVDNERAFETALVNAAAQTPLEMAGNLLQIGALKNLAKTFKVKGAGLKRVAAFGEALTKGAVGEGTEEFLQQYPDEIANIYAANPDLTPEEIASEVWKRKGEITKQAVDASKTGALGGTMLAGVGGVIAAPASILSYRSEKQQQIDAKKAETVKEETPEQAKAPVEPVQQEEPPQEQPQPEPVGPPVVERPVSEMQEQDKRHFDNEYQKNQEIKQQIDGDVMARDKELDQAEAAGIPRENLIPDEVTERQQIQSLRRAFTQNKRRLETLRNAGVNPEQQRVLERQIEEDAHRLRAYDKEEQQKKVVRNKMKLKRKTEKDIAFANRPYREDTGGRRSVDFNRASSVAPVEDITPDVSTQGEGPAVKPSAPQIATEPVGSPETPPAKQPWEMTAQDYYRTTEAFAESQKAQQQIDNDWDEARAKGKSGPSRAKADRHVKAKENIRERLAEELKAHRASVEKAISEGKIESHPDYPDLSPKEALPAAESMQRGAQEKAKEYRPKSSSKKDMISTIADAKKNAPKPKPLGSNIDFGKPATYNGRKRIDVKFDGISDDKFFGLKIEQTRSKDGWLVVRLNDVPNDKYGNKVEVPVNKSILPLKEAKAFAVAYLEGKTEPDGKVTFKTTDGKAEFKIFNSQYHLEQFENRVKKTPKVQYSTLTPQQAAKEHGLTYKGPQERANGEPLHVFHSDETGDTFTVESFDELDGKIKLSRHMQKSRDKANENFQNVTLEEVKDFFKKVKNSSVRKRKTDGAIIVQIGNRTPLRIKNVQYIGIDEAAFLAERKRTPGEGELAAGSYYQDEIKISRIGDKWTFAHESFHWIEESGVLNKSDLRAIDKAIEKSDIKFDKDDSQSEKRAKWFEANKQKRDTKGRLGKAIEKIRDFIDAFVNLFHRTARGVIRDIESGKIYDREGQAQQTVVPQYEKTAQRWYSQMQNFLEKKLPGKAPVAQLNQMLTSWANKGEFKQEELDWSGVLDWLDSQDGKVSKQDVLDYLAANNLRVEEVVKGGKLTHERLGWMKRGNIYKPSSEFSVGYIEALRNGKFVYNAPGGTRDLFNTLNEAKDGLLRAAENFGADSTKFSQHTIPGGDNYREIIITMPGILDEYQSPHWDEKAPAVHIRFHEDTVDGQHLIIIDEMQGDVYSDIRKKGSTSDSAKVIADLSKKYPNLPKDSGQWSLAVLEEIGATQAEQDRWYDARMRGKVPDAPWKKTYYLKAMQRMVRYAAENGFDGIAWTPGSVHFERWGSERIAWKWDGNGWIVNVKEQTGGNAGGVDIETEADARGMNESDGKHITTKEELRALIDTIAQRERYQYSHENYEAMLDARTDKTWKRMQEEDAGVSLPRKEGFENIYDEKIPNEVKKFFGKKAWGSPKVGTIEVVTEKRIGENITPELLAKAAAKADSAGDAVSAKWLGEQVKILEDTGDYSYAIHNPNKWPGADNPPSFYVDQVREESDKTQELWHLPITHQMKSKALREGMPLYKTVQYSTKVEEDKLSVMKHLKGAIKNRKLTKKQREDFSLLELYADVPQFYTKEIPTTRRMWEDGQEREQDKHELEDHLSINDGVNSVNALGALRKADKKEFTKLGKRLVRQDQLRDGYVIKKDEDGVIGLFDPYGKLVEGFPVKGKGDKWFVYRNGEKVNQVGIKKYDAERIADRLALEEGMRRESLDLKKKGFSDQAIDAVTGFRKSTNKGFEILMDTYRNLERMFKAAGKAMPQITVPTPNGEIKISLKQALAEMGEHRGYYFPRIRKPGSYILVAKKEGEYPILETFGPVGRASKMLWRQTELQNKGYTVETMPSEKVGEDVFGLAGEAIKIQQIVNAALSKTDQQLKGIDQENVLKALLPSVEDFFAKSLAEQIANVYKVRGSRVHMVKRSDDVWLGYEEDPELALAQYIRGIAGGESKKNYALKVVRHFTGTDISFDEFNAMREFKGTYQEFKDEVEKLDPEKGLNPSLTEDLFNEKNDPDAAKKANKEIEDLRNQIDAVDGNTQQHNEKRLALKLKLQEARNWQYRDYTELVRERMIDQKTQPIAFKWGTAFIEDTLRNSEAADRAIGTIKGLAVAKYLAFRVFSAPLVNLTALATSVPATMKSYGIPLRKTGTLMARALKDYARYKKGTLSAEKSWVFQEIEKRGWDNPQFNSEAMNAIKGKYGRFWDKTIELGMWTFSESERLNRIVTIAGSYYGLSKNGEDHIALKKSKEVSDESHGVYNKGNYPHIARGGNPFAQIVRMAYVFKTFSHNYLANLARMGLQKHEYTAALYMLLSPAVIAGAGASVLMPVVEAILKAMGFDEPEEEMYQAIGRSWGGTAENFARFGLAGSGGYGVSLKGSLSIGITDLPTTPKDVFGAPGSVIADFYEGLRSVSRGDLSKGAERILPLGIGNILKGIREGTEGVTTRTNAPVFYGREQLKASPVEAFYRGFGFNPARMAGVREKQWKERRISYKYSEQRREIYAKLKKFFLQPAHKRDKAEYAEILGEIYRYNEKARGKLDSSMPLITPKSIKTNIKRSMKPTKRERLRQ